jgi:predicted N-acetyltransferase YhbS
MTLAEMIRRLEHPPARPEESFVAFAADGTPVGTASLVQRDLDSRPDLGPCLAGVFVLPAHRGQGHAAALVRHVEGFAAGLGIARLWLYTDSAAPLYAGLGWQPAGTERTRRSGKQVQVMVRDLSPVVARDLSPGA